MTKSQVFIIKWFSVNSSIRFLYWNFKFRQTQQNDYYMAKAFPAHLKPGHYQKNLIYKYSDLSVDKKTLLQNQLIQLVNIFR